MADAKRPDIALRAPERVMKLARLGAFHQTRLSFMRQLLRRFKAEKWRFEKRVFDIDANGIGHAVYVAHTPNRSYSLVAFAHDLPDDQRTDRVIATAWDATFTLFDGIPTKDDIARLADNVPRQEAGRLTGRELSMSRANRSTRLWDYVVARLAAGKQPDARKIAEVGYLMRTTAVYGSGKFGAADRETLADRPEFQAPFQAEMLSVYLTRSFVMDLVEHMARVRAPDRALALDPALRRRFGIGNSTGLGMAPFLINHPALLHNWIAAREEALRRVRALPEAPRRTVSAFHDIATRARIHAHGWRSDHPGQQAKLQDLRNDMQALMAHLQTADMTSPYPWDRLWRWGEETLTLEGQEQLVSLLLEPHGELVDDLCGTMAAEEDATSRIDGAMPLSDLRAIVEDVYGWALDIDWSASTSQARIWYTSEEKLEPRMGERFAEALCAYEQPLCPGRDAARMHAALLASDAPTVAEFLLQHPGHRHIARRAQIAAERSYAEIRDNTLDASVMPIDMLRMKLSFFGACHFDPRSDRWVRINMYRNAPFPEDLAHDAADDWTLPRLPEAGE